MNQQLTKPLKNYNNTTWQNRMDEYTQILSQIMIPNEVNHAVMQSLLSDIDYIYTIASLELANIESQYNNMNDLISIMERERFDTIKNQTIDSNGKLRKLNNDETDSLVLQSIISDYQKQVTSETNPYKLRANYKARVDFLKNIVFLCKSKTDKLNIIAQTLKLQNYVSRGGNDV